MYIGPMYHVSLIKKCTFVEFLKVFFRKLFNLPILIFCHVNWTYLLHGFQQKVYFSRFLKSFLLFFWSIIHFRLCEFSLNFRKLFILLIFLFCLVNWTYVPRKFDQKCTFIEFLRVFYCFLAL